MNSSIENQTAPCMNELWLCSLPPLVNHAISLQNTHNNVRIFTRSFKLNIHNKIRSMNFNLMRILASKGDDEYVALCFKYNFPVDMKFVNFKSAMWLHNTFILNNVSCLRRMLARATCSLTLLFHLFSFVFLYCYTLCEIKSYIYIANTSLICTLMNTYINA